MAVTVRWLVAQRDLGLGLRAGAVATDVPITFVITTELSDPTPWLTGGEMLLTTGIGIPPGDEGCRAYVRRLTDRGVSGLGFGVGVSRDSAPQALVAAADEFGLALVDVPLPTPFVAVARTVIDEIARRANRSQVAAGRAQQRMTRAAVAGGPSATLRELAVGCGGTALLLDRGGRVVQAHPVDVDPAASREVGELARAHRAASAVGPVTATAGGRETIVTQPIRVGDREHGHLGVVLPHEPLATDHVLIGHANSLLALDFERPLRLLRAQWRINAAALRLVLSAGGESDEASRLVDEAADPSGVRALVVRGGDPGAVVAAMRTALHDAGRPVFVAETGGSAGVVVLLGGADGRSFADGLVANLAPGERSRLQLGLGAPHAAGAVADAVAAAELAARAARPGGGTVDASALAGRSLFADPGTRAALGGLDRALLEPLRAQDGGLAQALRAYLENHGQWEGTAAALGVHRHTARARVARAEEVLGVDLKSARVRAELLLALLLGDE